MKQLCLVCQNVDCKSRGSEQLLEELEKRAAERGLTDVEVRSYMCFGACHDGPNVVIYPDKVWYAGVKPENVPEIVSYIHGAGAPTRLDTIDPALKEMIFQLLDAGLY